MSNNNSFYKYFDEQHLTLAWERMVRWTDRTCKDHFGIKMFGHNLEKNIQELSQLILSGKYKPSKPQKFYVPKSSKTQRTKTILIVEDAIVYQAIANTIATNNYDIITENEDFVFGSVLADEVRLGVDILKNKDNSNLFFFKHYSSLYKQFADSINKAILEDDVTHKFETDITGFFDSIPHYNLLYTLMEKFNVEEDILNLLSECLNAWSGTRNNYTFGVGIPQGSQPSFFFANALLYNLDNLIKNDGHIYYRYMDDIRIYAYSEEDLVNILIKIDAHLKGMALSLNAKKTSIEEVKGNLDDSKIIFDFLYGDNLLENETEDITETEFDTFSEKFGHYSLSYTIKKKEEINSFWHNMYNEAVDDLLQFFKEEKLDFKNSKIDDRELLEIAYRFRISVQGLKKVDSNYNLETNYLKYWDFLLRKIPWRADQFCWVLKEYENKKPVKKLLFDLIDFNSNYEWVRHHIYMTLGISQKISKREWQKLFRRLKVEEGYFSRIALYKLLLFRLSDKQQLAQIIKKITQEHNSYMKKELLFYVKEKQLHQFTIQELIQSFGI